MAQWNQGQLAPEQIQNAVVGLKKRQQRLTLFAVLAASFWVTSVLGLWLQHDLVYSFYGLSHQVQQLHIPVSVDARIFEAEASHPDYFFSLLSWFAWLCLKVVVSFFAAFWVVHLLKKIHFFYQRFRSFVLKFVAWLIAFIVLWSGLTYLQHDMSQEQQDPYAYLTEYGSNLQDSQIAQYSEEAEMPMAVKSYLLAQTALLHRPVDLAAATPYTDYLMTIERNDKNFSQYGFKPEQLWAMQYQVYGKAITPSTQALAATVAQAEHLSGQIKVGLVLLNLLIAMIGLLLFVLSYYLKGRFYRIEQRLQS